MSGTASSDDSFDSDENESNDGQGFLFTALTRVEESYEDDGLEADDYDEELARKAAEFLDGGLSFNDYEAIIKKKPAGAERNIPPAVAALIGQANMTYVRGQHEDTLRLCKEAIRLAPYASEPYRTLSEMYEDLGDRERSLQLGMIAAAMRADAADWEVLGEKASELSKMREALYCYTEAVRKDNTLLKAHIMRIRLLTELGETRNLVLAHQRLVDGVLPEAGLTILEFAKQGAQYLHAENDVKGALAIMETAFRKAPTHVTSDDVNLILELYIALNKYERLLEVVATHCDVEVEAEDLIVKDNNTDEMSTVFKVTDCTIKKDIPHQIRAKLAVALINLKAFHLVDKIVAPMLEVVDEFGDLLMDVIEALMGVSEYSEALRLIKILVLNPSMNEAAQVWLHYAECLRQLGRKEEAVSAYLEVMHRAPHQTEARFIASELLNELGRSEEALDALTQDPEAGSLDVGILFERCLILKDNPQRKMEFLAVGRLLLTRHCPKIRNRKDVPLFTRFTGVHKRPDVQKRLTDDTTEEHPTYVEGRRMPSPEEEWSLFKKLCQVAFETKQYAVLQRLAFSALGSDFLCRKQERETEVRIIATLACVYNKDAHHGFNLIRQLIMNGFDNNRAWNIFNLIVKQTEEIRHQKFVVRLIARMPSHPILPVVFANNCFMAGSYKQAVSEYLLFFKHERTPLTALMIAITFVQLASQKHANNVNSLVAQGMAFLGDYKKLRGDSCMQEIHYNFGRLHHHLGLLPTAVYHYKLALETPAPSELFDLKREIAYNLAVIYQGSDSHDLARYYIDKYIVI